MLQKFAKVCRPLILFYFTREMSLIHDANPPVSTSITVSTFYMILIANSHLFWKLPQRILRQTRIEMHQSERDKADQSARPAQQWARHEELIFVALWLVHFDPRLTQNPLRQFAKTFAKFCKFAKVFRPFILFYFTCESSRWYCSTARIYG